MDDPIDFRFHALHRHHFSLGERGSLSLPPHEGLTRSLVVLRGIIRAEWSGRLHLLATGEVLHLAGNQGIRLFDAGLTGGRCVELLFGGKLPAEYAAHLYSNYNDAVPVENQARVVSFVRMFGRCAKGGGGGRDRTREARLVFKWFLMVHRCARIRRENLGEFLTGGRARLLSVAGEHGFSLAAMARHFGCSASHLTMQLQAVLGMPVGRFLREARWNRVLQLMGTTRLHLGDIARKCGYDSVPAFHAAFKKYFGMSPGMFRKKTPSGGGGCGGASGNESSPRPGSKIQRMDTAGSGDVTVVAGSKKMAGAHPAVIQEGPYYHFDGGEVDYPFAKPFRLSIQTLSNAVQWVLTLSGRAVFEIGGHRIEVAPGMVLLFPQPINATWVSPDERPWHRVWIKMRGEWAVQTMERFIDGHGWLVKIPLRSRPVMLARKWLPFWHQESGRHSFDGCEAAFEWFLSWQDLISRGQVEPLLVPDMRTFSSRQFFRRIKSVTSYAKEVGYSRSHLSRKLKYQWTETPQPGTFLRKQKLAQAEQELRSTSLPVAEIARRAHYAHTSTFIQAFHRAYGASPLQYRLHACGRT